MLAPAAWAHRADFTAYRMEFLPGPVTQKLETPVLDFHTREQLTVHVDFPKGILSERSVGGYHWPR